MPYLLNFSACRKYPRQAPPKISGDGGPPVPEDLAGVGEWVDMVRALSPFSWIEYSRAKYAVNRPFLWVKGALLGGEWVEMVQARSPFAKI